MFLNLHEQTLEYSPLPCIRFFTVPRRTSVSRTYFLLCSNLSLKFQEYQYRTLFETFHELGLKSARRASCGTIPHTGMNSWGYPSNYYCNLYNVRDAVYISKILQIFHIFVPTSKLSPPPSIWPPSYIFAPLQFGASVIHVRLFRERFLDVCYLCTL